MLKSEVQYLCYIPPGFRYKKNNKHYKYEQQLYEIFRNTTISFVTVRVIRVFAEDYANQNGPCLNSIACMNPELRKQMFAPSEHE